MQPPAETGKRSLMTARWSVIGLALRPPKKEHPAFHLGKPSSPCSLRGGRLGVVSLSDVILPERLLAQTRGPSGRGAQKSVPDESSIKGFRVQFRVKGF